MNSDHMDGYMFVFFWPGYPSSFSHVLVSTRWGGSISKSPAVSNYLGGMILLAPTVDLRFAIHHCPFQQHEAMAKLEVWL